MSMRSGESSLGGFTGLLRNNAAPTVVLSLSSRLLPAHLPHERLLTLAAAAVADGRITSFLLQDPGAGREETLIAFAGEISRMGGTPLASVSCAGRMREEVMSLVEGLAAAGAGAILAVTGDMPAGPPSSSRKPHFDIDSVKLLMMLSRKGDRHPARAIEAGCVVSPFKSRESEIYWQYEKLFRKSRLGAGFVVTQPGYDLERYGEVLRFCRHRAIDIPAVAGVIVPDGEMARHLGEGGVPGVRLPQELLEEVAKEAREGESGRRRGLLRAASVMRNLRGMGYQGLLLEGAFRRFDDIAALLASYDAPRTAGPQPPRSHFLMAGFRYFDKDREGSGTDVPAPLSPPGRQHILYHIGYVVDLFAFKKPGPISRFLAWLCRFCDRGPVRRRLLWLFELQAKAPLYGCRMCGDCALYACAFICYVRRCPKKLLNGPCGGGLDGWCEAHPGRRRCLWVDVHRRLKVFQERPSFPARPIPPDDRNLHGTCSWINFFLGRDHQQKGRRDGSA